MTSRPCGSSLRRARKNLPRPLLLLLIGIRALENLGGELTLAFGGRLTAPLPLFAELTERVSFEALRNGSEEKAEGHADARLAGFGVDEPGDFVDACVGRVFAAAVPEIESRLVVDVGDIAPQRCNHPGQDRRRCLLRIPQ